MIKALALLLCLLPNLAFSAGGFVAREWGVLDLPRGYSHAELVAMPLPTPYPDSSQARQELQQLLHDHGTVREPVLYIESADKKPFALKVTFPGGWATSTFPRAVTKAASLTWAKIGFKAPKKLSPLAECDRPIVDLLGTEGADELFVNAQASRYLFYEGHIEWSAALILTKDAAGLRVKNASNLTLKDVLVALPGPKGERVAQVGTLAPLEERGLELHARAADEAFPDLMAQGFKAPEAATFQRIWRPVVLGLEPRLPKQGHAFYQLPADACNAVSVLEFQPKPKSLTRALFVREELSLPK